MVVRTSINTVQPAIKRLERLGVDGQDRVLFSVVVFENPLNLQWMVRILVDVVLETGYLLIVNLYRDQSARSQPKRRLIQ